MRRRPHGVVFVLELVLDRELDQTWLIRGKCRGESSQGRCGTESGYWIAEVSLIGDVECLGAELQVRFTIDRELFE